MAGFRFRREPAIYLMRFSLSDDIIAASAAAISGQNRRLRQGISLEGVNRR